MTLEAIALIMALVLVASLIGAMAGGSLTIPALMAARASPAFAIATNKLQGAFGSGGAFLAFALKGHIGFRRFAWPVAALIGSGGGALLLNKVDPSLLVGRVPILLILMTLYFLTAPRIDDDDRESGVGGLGLVFGCKGIGAYDGFFGPAPGPSSPRLQSPSSPSEWCAPSPTPSCSMSPTTWLGSLSWRLAGTSSGSKASRWMQRVSSAANWERAWRCGSAAAPLGCCS